jgi:hypothetical protein
MIYFVMNYNANSAFLYNSNLANDAIKAFQSKFTVAEFISLTDAIIILPQYSYKEFSGKN